MRAVVGCLLAVAVMAGCTGGVDVQLGVEVRAAGDRSVLVLVSPAGERVVAELGPEDGEVVHASLRPGASDALTLLVLARVPDDPPRYELRYLVDGPEGTSPLYWFPWSMQVDPGSAGVVDVPPLPVWSPDGSALAWVEWTEAGTRLRTVGWIDDGVTRNPSADASAYRLDDVPPGVQLEAWEAIGDGVAVMRGSLDGVRYRITVELGGELAAEGGVAS